MNETTRQSTGNLETESLLQKILDSAVTILNCEAGDLFLVDEKTNELVLKATAGPAVQNPAGQRLAIGTGIAGKVVQSRRPVISNHVQQASARSASPDQTRGFVTQSILAVPLLVKENIIGVLEVINRKDGLPFVEDDQNLLSGFGDHAALAIINVQRYQEVQSANEAKSEFVSFVAHELKNPMTSIKGYTELLAKGAAGPITKMQADILGTIHSNVERMSTLVSDLNDSSKIEAGRLRLDFKAIDLAGVVDEVMRCTKSQLDDKKQSANVKIPSKLPKIRADPTHLAQIITNLVSNANKYAPENGLITIGAEKSANHWDPEGAAEVLHIWVQDDGIGISQEDQNKVFQKFFRSDDPKARESPGTGLGLNITKSLIEMMGGCVWFESDFRQGTTFHFTVPVVEG